MSELPRMVLHVMNAAGGGAALSTIGIIEGMAERGVRSAVVCHPAGTAEEKERLLEVTDGRALFRPLYWWNSKNRAKRWKRPLIEARQLLLTRGGVGSSKDIVKKVREWGVDLIHTNTILTPEGGLAAAWLNLPHVWHLRERVGPNNPFRFAIEGRRWGRVVERLSNVVVANAPSTAAAVEPWLRRGHVRVVENAIDTERFSGLRSQPSSGRLVVGMIGNLTCHWKRHDLFLDVAERVKRPDVEFRLYGHVAVPGADEYVDGLRKRVGSAALANRTQIRGFVDSRQIMNEIDVLLHPTGNESFGRIVVEAMAASRPVIGISAGGVNDIVDDGQTGLLAPVGDVAALSAHLERLADDVDLCRSLGRRGREVATARFSMDNLLNKVERVYSDVAHTRVHGWH